MPSSEDPSIYSSEDPSVPDESSEPEESSVHEHTWSTDWDHDENGHWHNATCGCEEIADYASHDFASIVHNPTFEEGGYTEFKCKVCGYSYEGDFTDPLEHNYSSEWSHDEEKHWHACTDAGYEDERADEADHIYGDWITDEEAMMDVPGKAHRVCAVCDYVQEDIIPALPHVHDVDWEYSEIFVPGSSSTGDATYTAARHGVCSLCQEEVVEELNWHNSEAVTIPLDEYDEIIHRTSIPTYNYYLENVGTMSYSSSGQSTTNNTEVATAEGSAHRVIEAKVAEYTLDAAHIRSLAGSQSITIQGFRAPGEKSLRYFVIGFLASGRQTIYTANWFGVATLRMYQSQTSSSLYMSTGMVYFLRTADEFNAMVSSMTGVGSITLKEDLSFYPNYEYDADSHWRNAIVPWGDFRDDEAPHSFSSEVIDPTFETKGFTVHTCDVCGYQYTSDFVDPLEHSYSETYSYDESEHWRACIDSGYEGEYIDRAAHDYGEWDIVEAAAMDVPGLKKHTCETCGYVEEEVIPALPHVHSYEDAWSADETHHWHAATCIHAGTEKGDYAEHDFDSGTITPPTTTEKGYTTYTCQTCGYSYVDPNSYTEALYDSQVGDFTFSYNSFYETYAISGYTGDAKDVYLPREYDGHPVDSMLSNDIFKNMTNIEHVYVPDTYKSLDFSYGFRGCTNLEAIVVDPNNASFVSDGPAVYTKNRDTLEFVCQKATGELVLPEGLKTVEYFASQNGITSLVIPSTLETFDYSLSSNNFNNLEEISVASGNPAFSTVDNILLDKAQMKIVFVPAKIQGEITLPATVTDIGTNLSGRPGITKIDLSSTAVTTLAYGAFRNSSASEIRLPDTLETIGSYAFGDTKKLTSLTIPEGVTTLNGYAFSGSNLESLSLPATLTSINDYAFSGMSKLAEISMKEGNPNYTVYGGLLYDSGFTQIICAPSQYAGEVIIPDTITDIGTKFQSLSKVTRIVVPDSVTALGASAFSGCYSLRELVLGAGIETIADTAFPSYQSALSSIIVSDANPHYTAYDGALYNKELTTLILVPMGYTGRFVLPESVTTLANNDVFRWRPYIYSIQLNANITDLTADSFYQCNYLREIINPGNCPITKPSSSSWTVYASIDDVTTVSDENDFIYTDGTKATLAGYAGRNLDIVVPEGVTKIGDSAFFGLPIHSLTFADSVKDTGERICQNCTELVSVHFGAELIRVWQLAFYGCENLKTVNLDAPKLYWLSDSVFSNTGLEEVEITSKFTLLGSSIFSGCKQLKKAIFRPTCYKAEKPWETSGRFGDRMFAECPNLEELTIGCTFESTYTLGYFALYCTSLETVYYDGTMEQFELLQGNRWANSTKVTVVHCSDGDLPITHS